MKSFLRLTRILTLLLVASQALAVNIITTNKLCPAAPLAVRTINALPRAYPKDWTMVVVCAEGEWQYIQRKADAMNTNHAFTNFEHKTTIVRGDIFLNPEIGRPPGFILLHELGHIDCACNDENKAEKFANQHYK